MSAVVTVGSAAPTTITPGTNGHDWVYIPPSPSNWIQAQVGGTQSSGVFAYINSDIYVPNPTLNANQTYSSADFGASTSGLIQWDVSSPSSPSGQLETALFLDPSSLTIAVDEKVAPVPEPSTWAMILIGFCGLGWLSYWRKNGAPRFA